MAHGKMSGQIFISYRRDTSAMSAGRLYDRLSSHFASNQIFMDVDTIEPGVDFVRTIEEAVAACDVLIAVIGGRWLISPDEKGRRRLDNPEDFVRVEIATALKRGIRVIPVLVEGASMPRSGDLPNDLKSLVRRQALEVSHNRFRADSERLIGAVGRALESARAEQQREREEKERLEAEQRQREEQKRLERLEAEQPPRPFAPTPPAKPEADQSSAETSKVVYPQPKPTKPDREKPPPSSSGGTGGKSPSKQVIAFLAIAAVLVVGGLIYLASQSPLHQPAPGAAVTPSPPVMAAPTVEEKTPRQPLVSAQPSAQPNAPVAVAITLPPVVSAGYRTSIDRVHCFAIGNNGRLINFSNGQQWVWEDQGTPPGATALSSPSVGYQTRLDRLVCFVVGNNGHLYINLWYDQLIKWIWADQETPPGATAVSSPSVVYQTKLDRLHCFVIGNNGHLYINFWNEDGQQWIWEDQGTPPGATAVSSPSVVYQTKLNRLHCFVIGNNGHLYINFWNEDGQQWIWEDQGTPPGVTAVSSPSAGYRTSIDRVHCFVIGNNGHLYINFSNGQQWVWEDQGTPPGVTAVSSPSAGYRTSIDRVHCFVIGNNGHLYINFSNGQQ